MPWSIANSYFGRSPRGPNPLAPRKSGRHGYNPPRFAVSLSSPFRVRERKRPSFSSSPRSLVISLPRIFQISPHPRLFLSLFSPWSYGMPSDSVSLYSVVAACNGAEASRKIAFLVRELSLIRSREGTPCTECTVKFVIGVSIVAVSTVRRKCRFLSPLSRTLLSLSLSLSFHRSFVFLSNLP